MYIFFLILLFLKTLKIYGTGGNRIFEVVHLGRAEQKEVNSVYLRTGNLPPFLASKFPVLLNGTEMRSLTAKGM